MKSKTTLILLSSLILMVGYPMLVPAVTDAELDELERQIEQQEAEENKQAEASAKRKAEFEKQRLEEEQKRIEEEKRKLSEEKRKLEEARLAELERKQQEEEAIASSVTVIFFRKSAFTGETAIVHVTHNDVQIASILNGSSFTYSTAPGTQTFGASYTYADTIQTFQFEPGQTYYIFISFGSVWNFEDEIILQLVTEAERNAAIK